MANTTQNSPEQLGWGWDCTWPDLTLLGEGVCSHRCPGCLIKLLENAMSCQMKLLEDTFLLLLPSGTWCLCVKQLLWGKETSRTVTKFIYDQ